MTEAFLQRYVGQGKGRVRSVVVQSLSNISMTTSNQPQNEVDIPSYADVIGFIFELTASTTGTLSGANTLASALSRIGIRDVTGKNIFQEIRGVDLNTISTYQGIGQTITVATVSASNQTMRWFVPCNIERKDMTSRIQVTIAPYSDMASSGATGGTVSLTTTAVYLDNTNVERTTRYMRITQSIVSGANRFAPNLPKQVPIVSLLGTVGTESNITNFNFSADGNAELQQLTLGQITAMEDWLLVDGHLSGRFSLFNTAFVSNDRTILDVNAGGSDTIQWLLVLAD